MNTKTKLAVSTFAMLLLIISILLSCFQLVIYGDPDYKFYQKEYEKYCVTESLNMEIEDVMTVSNYMMDYLIGKEAKLSIEADVDGSVQDFFNEQDRLHMADVKRLFLGGLKLRNILLVVSVLILAVLCLMEKKKKAWFSYVVRSYGMAFLVFLGAIVLLGACCATNFTAFFTTFHHVFFTNDLWLFDPATDYMIRMLPEGFFFDITAKIMITFLTVLMSIQLLLLAIRVLVNRNNK